MNSHNRKNPTEKQALTVPSYIACSVTGYRLHVTISARDIEEFGDNAKIVTEALSLELLKALVGAGYTNPNVFIRLTQNRHEPLFGLTAHGMKPRKFKVQGASLYEPFEHSITNDVRHRTVMLHVQDIVTKTLTLAFDQEVAL